MSDANNANNQDNDKTPSQAAVGVERFPRGPLKQKNKSHYAILAIGAVVLLLGLVINNLNPIKMAQDLFEKKAGMTSSPNVSSTPSLSSPLSTASPNSEQSTLAENIANIKGSSINGGLRGSAVSAGLTTAPPPAVFSPTPALTTAQIDALRKMKKDLNNANNGTPFNPLLANLYPNPSSPQTPVPQSVLTPAPALAVPKIATIYSPGSNVPSMMGVTPGQQSGITPQTINSLLLSDQASFLSTRALKTTDLYSKGKVAPAKSNNEIFPGDPIYVSLTHRVTTSLPGLTMAKVMQDTRSHLWPFNILIPAGSIFYGYPNSDVSQYQNRVQIKWLAIIFPNGATLPLQSVQAYDIAGSPGISADVNRHVGHVYTTTIIATAISALTGMLAARAAITGVGLVANPSFAQTAAASLGGQIAQNAGAAASAAQSQMPTLIVHRGTKFTISFATIQELPSYDKIAERDHPVITHASDEYPTPTPLPTPTPIQPRTQPPSKIRN